MVGGGGGGGMRGSPLAMLAAQCNKLTNKSPPPLADAAVGKGFHPWKKCSGQSLTSGSPEETRTNSQPSSPAQSTYSHTTSPAPQYGKYLSYIFQVYRRITGRGRSIMEL